MLKNAETPLRFTAFRSINTDSAIISALNTLQELNLVHKVSRGLYAYKTLDNL